MFKQKHDYLWGGRHRISEKKTAYIAYNAGRKHKGEDTMCMAAERLKMDIPQQAVGWATNQHPGKDTLGFDWLPGIAVVMMMRIGSCLCGLYSGTEAKHMDG